MTPEPTTVASSNAVLTASAASLRNVDGSVTIKGSNQGFEAAHGPRLDAVADPWPVYLTANQPALLQDLQMLRDGRLRERQLLYDLTANTCVLAHQDAQDLNARWVPERLRQLGQLIIRLRALYRTQNPARQRPAGNTPSA
ncbi:MAG: hypothetical protein QM756_07695 [Polyangiaceae bacterium]